MLLVGMVMFSVVLIMLIGFFEVIGVVVRMVVELRFGLLVVIMVLVVVGFDCMNGV